MIQQPMYEVYGYIEFVVSVRHTLCKMSYDVFELRIDGSVPSRDRLTCLDEA